MWGSFVAGFLPLGDFWVHCVGKFVLWDFGCWGIFGVLWYWEICVVGSFVLWDSLWSLVLGDLCCGILWWCGFFLSSIPPRRLFGDSSKPTTQTSKKYRKDDNNIQTSLSKISTKHWRHFNKGSHYLSPFYFPIIRTHLNIRKF